MQSPASPGVERWVSGISEVSQFWDSMTWAGLSKKVIIWCCWWWYLTFWEQRALQILETDRSVWLEWKEHVTNGHGGGLRWPGPVMQFSQNQAREVIINLSREWVTSLLSIIYHYTQDIHIPSLIRFFPLVVTLLFKARNKIGKFKRIYCI